MGKKTKIEFEERLAQIVAQGADATAKDWMRVIEEDYGKVPLIFKRMGERPEVLISHLLYKSTVAETSQLDPKYVELISMAVGAALKCPHCTGYHMQAALKMGATRDEILEVVLLAGLISNSSVLANAYRIVDEKLEKCIPCETKVGNNGKTVPQTGRSKKTGK
ncbi:MAG: carboxymuconolactone decarboxylase family protein [Methanoregula sp.]|nr:carboxymuconolactone decarboxylase family protein [Methanoregula sp.]